VCSTGNILAPKAAQTEALRRNALQCKVTTNTEDFPANLPGSHSAKAYDVAVADVTVAIFTFTRNEATAVTELLARLYVDLPVFGTTVWTQTKQGDETLEGRLSDGRIARVEHHSLSAQGNVVAAAALSRSTRENWADYHVFYGCRGTVDSALVGQCFGGGAVELLALPHDLVRASGVPVDDTVGVRTVANVEVNAPRNRAA
jgi:hypothetical protein